SRSRRADRIGRGDRIAREGRHRLGPSRARLGRPGRAALARGRSGLQSPPSLRFPLSCRVHNDGRAEGARRRGDDNAAPRDGRGSSSMSDAANSAGPRGSAVSRRAFIGGSAALAGSALLGACSGGDSPAGSSAGASSSDRLGLTFLTILPPQSLTFAPELLADAGGYFANHGLDVRFELTRGSAQAVQLVLAGRAPLTRISQIEGMRAAANRGAPLVNVGMVFKDSTIRYVSSAANPLLEPG